MSILCVDLCILVFNLQFGYIVLTTSAGIMDLEEASRKNVGGKVLGFVMLTRMKTLVLLLVGSL